MLMKYVWGFQELFLLSIFIVQACGNSASVQEAFVEKVSNVHDVQFVSVDEIIKDNFWYHTSFEFNSARLHIDSGNPSYTNLQRLALRCVQTCLRLNSLSATCYTQLGALRSESSNATEQLRALPAFLRAARLQPSVK